jgi:4-oxalocrotonate tautomerase
MPIIHVHLFEGRTIDQKRKAASSITQAVVGSLNVSADHVRIIFHDMTKHDYSIGGELVVDREKK